MAWNPDYAYYRQALAGHSLPLAWLDLDALRANADAVLKAAAGKPVRVVSKSIRCVQALSWILEYDAGFQGILCFHPSEAVFLSRQGFDDLVVAYPCMQADSLRETCRETAAGKRLVLMVDCAEHLRAIDRIAREIGVVQPVCFDLDMSMELPGLYFGVRRSPLRTPEQVQALCRELEQCRHLRLAGVMGYEAQIAGVADLLPGKTLQNLALPLLKRRSIEQVRERRGKMLKALRDAGLQLDFVNGGGTGSLTSTTADPAVTEIAVGSAFFSPHLFDHYRDFRYQPAAGFALEVTRCPSRGYVTCAGGGYIASGAVGAEKLPLPWLPEGLRLDDQEGAGEVQTPLRGKIAGLKPGDPVFFRHAKAGELCERFERLVVIEQGRVREQWPTYRGQGQCFL